MGTYWTVTSLFWLAAVSAFSGREWRVSHQATTQTMRRRLTLATKALTFDATFAAQSEPVSVPSPERAMEYFRDPSCVVFGDSVPTTRQKVVPPSMLETWREACETVGAKQPDPSEDFLLNVRTKGLSMPGLTIEWSATIGAAVVLNSTTNLPCYEFVLIEDAPAGRGIKPLLWIFELSLIHI